MVYDGHVICAPTNCLLTLTFASRTCFVVALKNKWFYDVLIHDKPLDQHCKLMAISYNNKDVMICYSLDYKSVVQ